eukprot:TRINITY_DN3941_c0_g1_i3.p1 TRINITY_DN3941_c0_g1~~TRINITY_DN3941_c0_g1_i3.p1  ORF type:complete len:308 (-),score=49.47 TRINITY_DN3941_c0_g1_i3:101-1024(-)
MASAVHSLETLPLAHRVNAQNDVCYRRCVSATMVAQRCWRISSLMGTTRMQSALVAGRRSSLNITFIRSRKSCRGAGRVFAVSTTGEAQPPDAPEKLGNPGQTEAVPFEGEAEIDESVQRDVADVLKVLDQLRGLRNMSVQEVRLTLMIEDPREAERRRQMGIENESGCSRDEIADALIDVYEGRIPSDRLTLSTLAEDMRNWPRLEESVEESASRRKLEESLYARVTDTGVDRRVAARQAAMAMTWDAPDEQLLSAADRESETNEKKDLSNILPPWVGYGALYTVSVLPFVIGFIVVLILFLNSLQ